MRNTIFVRVDLPNGEFNFLPVTQSHLKLFGIKQSAVHHLTEARDMVIRIESEQEHDLGHFGRAEAMCLDCRSEAENLAFNQCMRWELLLHALGELEDINKKFGDGLADRLV